MVRKLLLILLLILLPCSALATDYYISAAGSGETCSSETPCALATAVATAGNEDTIFFKSDDTWTSTSTTTPLLTATAGVTYDGSTYGSGTRATLQAGEGYTGGATNSDGIVRVLVSNVTLRGLNIDGNQQNTTGISWGYGNAEAISNLLVENCLIHDIGAPTGNTSKKWMYGILISSRTNDLFNTDVTIINSEIYNCYHEGIAIYPSWNVTGNGVDRITVRGNTIYDNGTDDNGDYSSGVGMGIAITNNADNVTIEYNNIYDTSSGGYQPDGISIRTSPDPGFGNGAPNDCHIRYNIIRENHYGILFQDNYSQDFTVWVYGNLIFNNTAYGVGVGSQNWGNSALTFYNNTFYLAANGTDTFVGCVGLSRDSSTISGTPTFTFKNNIFNVVTTSTSATDYIPIYADYGSGTFTHNNNLYYRSTGTSYVYVSTGNWGSHTSYDGEGENIVTSWEDTAQITTPAFSGGTLPTGFTGTYGTNMVPNTDYFQLTVDSDAKDAGATLEGYTGAINGAGLATPIVRPLGAAFDIGAYEYGTVAQSGGSAGSGFFLQGVTIR
jgi:hypothetical protein